MLDKFLPGSRRLVLLEHGDLFGRRRETDQIEVSATDQFALRGRRIRRETLGVEFRNDERVDGISDWRFPIRERWRGAAEAWLVRARGDSAAALNLARQAADLDRPRCFQRAGAKRHDEKGSRDEEALHREMLPQEFAMSQTLLGSMLIRLLVNLQGKGVCEGPHSKSGSC